VKESDRIHALAVGLSALGVRVTELPDGLIIVGGELRRGAVRSFADHRIAMAFSIAGLAGTGQIVLEGISCVDISFPSFYSLVRDLTGPTIKHS
jgi:3-phosphoshikimate 1-carboxyvinyltransferase